MNTFNQLLVRKLTPGKTMKKRSEKSLKADMLQSVVTQFQRLVFGEILRKKKAEDKKQRELVSNSFGTISKTETLPKTLSTPDFQKCVRFSITLRWHDVGQAIQGVRDNQGSANGSKKTWMTMTKHGEDEDHTCQRGNEEQSARITPTMEAGERTFPFHFIISPCSKPTACAYCAY